MSLSQLISEMLELDEQEVKDVIPMMSLSDLIEIASAIRADDRDKVFDIYNGYLL